MHRKLVKFDGRRFLAVDQVALRRVASHLLKLTPMPSEEDPYGIRERLIPALNKVISGALEMPFMDEREIIGGRYIHDRVEGLLPGEITPEFQAAYSKFSVRARSLPLDPPHIEVVDGQQCAWMDFEDEGDWPEKVRYP